MVPLFAIRLTDVTTDTEESFFDSVCISVLLKIKMCDKIKNKTENKQKIAAQYFFFFIL